MTPEGSPENLQELLQRLRQACAESPRVSIDCLVQAVGQRSFGPVLLIPGLIVLSPLSGIPGLPSVMAAMVALITLQLLFGRRHFWLPRWLLKRRLPRRRFEHALHLLWRPAGQLDRLIKPRLSWLVRGPGYYSCALLCLALALAMPPMELVPFANSLSGAALCLLGLSLIARDGLLAVFAFCVSLAAISGFLRLLL